MIIGIMSDTHDRIPLIQDAVNRLNQEGAEIVLHAGDIVSPFVIPELARLKGRLIGVLGNNDGDPNLLRKRAAEVERLELRGTFALVGIDRLQVGVLHGHEADLLKLFLQRELFDLLVYGHSHRSTISQRGKTTVVNPGEVCGYLTGKSTVAVFDTETREAELLEL